MKNLILSTALLFQCLFVFGQLSATFNTAINTICDGSPCDYTGPSILINEIMISPTSFDGSISGDAINGGRGEWIELYNPNLCEAVDISCYFLANTTPYLFSNVGGGFRLPPNTIIPPAGFCLVRGSNAAPVPPALLVANGGNVVEVVVPPAITDPGICVGPSATRFWFPNTSGWFAFYDANGVPQDAVTWGTSATAGNPCVPAFAGCGNGVASLSAYAGIANDRKTQINSGAISDAWGQSIRRMPDGGTWQTNTGATPTYAVCNDICASVGLSSCSGTATVNASGGSGSYTYLWNDSEAQTTQQAVGLCAGTYDVTVNDGAGNIQTFSVEIVDFVPTVSVSLASEVCVNGGQQAVTVNPIVSGAAIGNLTGTGISGNQFNPQTSGVGTFEIIYDYTDENGCHNADTTDIVVNALPVVTLSSNSPYCNSSTPVNLTFSPAGGTLSGNGISNNQFTPSVAGVGTHTITYTYTDANSCTNSTTTQVEVQSNVVPTLTIPENICVDAPAFQMTVSPTGGTFQIDAVAATSTFNPAVEGVGEHIVIYTYDDGGGCSSSTQDTIDVIALPTLDILNQNVFCFGTNVVNVTPSPAGGTLSGDNLNGNNLELATVTPGTYALHYEYTDGNGCANQIDENYIVGAQLFPAFEFTTDCFQNAVFTSTVNNSNYTYAWNIDAALSSGVSTEHDFANAGQYAVTLTITDQNNCSFDTVQVANIPVGIGPNEFVVPNVLTANNDLINDSLSLNPALNGCIDYTITIFNRWGNVVFVGDENKVFTGKDEKGNELSSGVYFYAISSDDLDCENEHKGFCYGNITLMK